MELLVSIKPCLIMLKVPGSLLLQKNFNLYSLEAFEEHTGYNHKQALELGKKCPSLLCIRDLYFLSIVTTQSIKSMLRDSQKELAGVEFKHECQVLKRLV